MSKQKFWIIRTDIKFKDRYISGIVYLLTFAFMVERMIIYNLSETVLPQFQCSK